MPSDQPSEWILRHAGLVPPGGHVLDVAAGRGRHSRFFLARGHPVTAVDIDVTGLRGEPALRGGPGPVDDPVLTVVQADLEADPWPFAVRAFAGVVVTRYLHRPLLPVLVAAVAPGGVLLYETFMVGHEAVADRPSNPDYLARPGELRAAAEAGGLTVVAVEEGPVTGLRPAVLTRLAAVRDTGPGRWPQQPGPLSG